MSTLSALLAWLLAIAGATDQGTVQPCDAFQPGTTCVQLPGESGGSDSTPPPPRDRFETDKDDDPIYNGF